MIDFHLHAFPDRLAARALAALTQQNGGIRPYSDGTLADLEKIMQRCGIEHGVVLSIATRPEQEPAVNDFAIRNNRQPLTFFGSIHPESQRWQYHLDKLCDAGLQGVKLHPEYQGFSVSDPKYAPLYRALGARGLITVFHAGLDLSFDAPGRCRPRDLARILPLFDGAPVVAAHMGGYLLWEEVESHLIGQDIHLDTSYCYANLPCPLARRLILEHGSDRILFGSDLPWSDPSLERRFIEHLGLSDAQTSAILSGNARKLLGLPIG